jgi:murein DD-endopeptidase MepM/ murein hydrolase activator NlpD
MALPRGTEVEFFPPSGIINPEYEEKADAFRYFMDLLDEKHSYITGLWAERGTGGSRDSHEGVDIAAPFGTKIISPVDGRVQLKNSKLAGRTVGIEVDKALLLFAHMDKRYVKTGDRVKKGQVLGTVGMTGRTSGPHLHFAYAIGFPKGFLFGKKRYEWTDPVLWFYRQHYVNGTVN